MTTLCERFCSIELRNAQGQTVRFGLRYNDDDNDAEDETEEEDEEEED